MRISDWSSDVCSSDLRYSDHAFAAAAAPSAAAPTSTTTARRSFSGETNRTAGPRVVAVQSFGWTYCTPAAVLPSVRSEEHTSELQSLMRISYAVFCLKKKKTQ